MITPIVKYILKKRSKESDRLSSLVHGDLIMKMAVVAVFSEDESFFHMQSYVNELRKRGLKEVDFYVYFSSKKLLQKSQPNKKNIVFSNADLNLLGKYKSESLIESLKKNYDVLMDLTRGKALACDVLVSKLKASWKTGAYDADRTYLLDFMIDVKDEKDVRKLIHHLDYYITNFNKSKAA